MNRTAGLIVFARAPVPGKVKTRLIPHLGDRVATELYRTLALHVLSSVCRPSMKYDVELWCSPDTIHPFFRQLQQRFAIALHRQQGADLGERMANAMRYVLGRGKPAIIIGTDCPLLKRETIELIADKLARYDAAVIPAEDGGYVLLAMARFDQALFQAIPWGSADVMQRTRQVLEDLHWNVYEHETFWDVDRPDDIEKLKAIGLY